ncbi:MAG: putative lipid II flippase FtsW [Dehalococcoidia bacterium]|nr:putative lipid II flippase FtsW [Dehalococcoidia bacterium]
MAIAQRTGDWRPGRPDYALVALTTILTVTGLVAVYSSSFVIGLAQFGDSNHFIVRQVAWAILGLTLLALAARFNYQKYRPVAVPILLITIGMLVAVLVIGREGGGARRWLGPGELGVQPAEFAKLTVIIYLAAWLSSKGENVKSMEQGLLPFVILIGVVGGLIMLEPNLGTTLIICLITVTMFWVAGASIGQMAALFAAGTVAMAFLATAAGYRADRLTSFFDAELDPRGGGFQTLQSLIAMGNGGVNGLGLGASRAKFFYIPESQTDGVFAIIGEELGLIATAAIVLLYMTLMFRGFQVARRSHDDFGRYIATGITTWITVQALLNMGGITRVIPLTGVPLPFLSYGGSALASVLLAVGVLISISRFGNDRGGYYDRPENAHARRIIHRSRRR